MTTFTEAFERLPGLYRPWEIVLLILPDQTLLIEPAGNTAEGDPLVAIYDASNRDTPGRVGR